MCDVLFCHSIDLLTKNKGKKERKDEKGKVIKVFGIVIE